MRRSVGHGEVLYAPDFAVELIASALSDMVAEGGGPKPAEQRSV